MATVDETRGQCVVGSSGFLNRWPAVQIGSGPQDPSGCDPQNDPNESAVSSEKGGTPAESLGLLTPAVVRRFWTHVAPPNERGCRLWTGCGRGVGYGAFGVRRDGKQAVIDAHRAAYLIRFGSIPAGMCVLHECDVRKCVEHLRLGTKKDNHDDMIAKGRGLTPAQRSAISKAAKHSPPPQRRFTDDEVRTIRVRAAAGEPHAEIAFDVGVGHTSITRMVTGDNYRHVDPDVPRPARKGGVHRASNDALRGAS